LYITARCFDLIFLGQAQEYKLSLSGVGTVQTSARIEQPGFIIQDYFQIIIH
jgi:hypothetical protein